MTPRHIIEALVKYLVIKDYVDANHMGIMVNRRLHYIITIYVNNLPIIWYSKRHNIVESSSFVSEFVVLSIVKYII